MKYDKIQKIRTQKDGKICETRGKFWQKRKMKKVVELDGERMVKQESHNGRNAENWK